MAGKEIVVLYMTKDELKKINTWLASPDDTIKLKIKRIWKDFKKKQTTPKIVRDKLKVGPPYI